MNPELKRFIEDAKEWSLECITSSQCLCVGPCLYQGVNCQPTDVAAASVVTVYDGQSDQGKTKCIIKSQYACAFCCMPQPVFFRRGLYIDLTTNADGACVLFMPLKD